MFRHLQIPYPQERLLVGLADAGLRTARWLGWPQRSVARDAEPGRILLLRLERVGDLLMVVDAIAMVRSLAPGAHIDLVVGSWNRSLAQLIPGIDSIEKTITFQGKAPQNPLQARIASQPFVGGTFSRLDTYTLLNSTAMNAVLGVGGESLSGTYQVRVPQRQIFGTQAPIAGSFFGITAQGIGSVGMLINFAVTIGVSLLTPAPPQHVRDLVDAIRGRR